MAFPTEFNDSVPTVGDDNIKHPVYSFRVILERKTQEDIGPVTNTKTTSILHPDLHTESPDEGRANSENHEDQFSSLIPGLNLANIIRNDNGTFTAYGQYGVYLKETYVDVDDPLLAITNDPPYTSP